MSRISCHTRARVRLLVAVYAKCLAGSSGSEAAENVGEMIVDALLKAEQIRGLVTGQLLQESAEEKVELGPPGAGRLDS